MRFIPLFLAPMVLAGPVTAQSSAVTPSATTATKGLPGQLVTTYQRMLDGLVAVDTLALNKLLATNYTWTPSGDSTAYTRSQRFAKMLQSKDRLDSLYVRECRISLYQASAVGNCRVGQRGSFDGAGTGHSEVLSTVTFVKEAQGWRIASTHTLVTAPPPSPGDSPQ